MLYKKKSTDRLDPELFRQPTAEYRGTPFWAWNCKLERKELEWQLEVLRQMGFGGAHIHVRTGLSTQYLGQEYMELVKACVQKAKREEMLIWLYDEDRFPSGSAGGLVTKEKKYRGRYLLLTRERLEDTTGSGQPEAVQTVSQRLLACYDVERDPEGLLVDWRMIDPAQPAQHEKWYAYQKLRDEDPWYNNQTYVNTLDKAAMDRFLEITYDAYDRAVGEEFDKTIPSIFTDEPQYRSLLNYAVSPMALPWTDDLAQSFEEAYPGENLIQSVPELFWDRADGRVCATRYHYYDHICERFTRAYADNCGDWCRNHGLAFTGHVLREDSLRGQTYGVGEAMRAYRSYDLPGIDMLRNSFEYTTAKQAQSAVHQYGREGMMSELYGVTGWDFDFRGHKLYGDWQAALGVTIRVPHLSWVSMAGEGKRDYPASISYQSPWWEKYALVEDHFARVGTAMTRGKAVVKVGVIHPIESAWLHWSSVEQTLIHCDTLDENFHNVTEWLLFGGIDFDFLCESQLPKLCSDAGQKDGRGSAALKVGAMEYDTILVPGCETLRSTTLEYLEQFAAAGGNLIFAGEIPGLEDARPSDRGAALAQKAQCVSFDRGAILAAVEPSRIVEMRNETGALTNNLLYQLRQDGEGCWLFIAHGKEPYNKHISRYQDVKIRVQGAWKVTLYDTMTGETGEIAHSSKGGVTEITQRMYDYDSLLLWLEPAEAVTQASVAVQSEVSAQADVDTGSAAESVSGAAVKPEAAGKAQKIKFPALVPYTLSEPNALLLDQAEYALDDGPWQETEEILRIDDACRLQLGWPSRRQSVAQPWTITPLPLTHTVHLRFCIASDLEYVGARLALEDAEQVEICWNGVTVESKVTGWYVDKSIKTVELPPVKAGENVLELSIPFGERSNVEWVYLLGDFGVETVGRCTRIVAAREKLAFGDVTSQGLPFYGGNITYHVPVETDGGQVSVHSSYYEGVLQTLRVDGGEEIPLIYPPYTVQLGALEAGKHTFDITLYGHRQNGFGPIHNVDRTRMGAGPGTWRTEGENWSYEYLLTREGIMVSPDIMEWK